MSVVSGITLQVSDEDDAITVRVLVNSWLVRHHYGTLTSVEDEYGGNKHPQVRVFGAGYNHFDEEEFAKLILDTQWHYPECVVLLINPEEGPTKVVRPQAMELP